MYTDGQPAFPEQTAKTTTKNKSSLQEDWYIKNKDLHSDKNKHY